MSGVDERPDAPRVLATGIITIDQIYGVDDFPCGDGKYLATSFREIGGGVAANAAVTVARLGGAVQLVGCVGGDRLGELAVEELADEGIDVSAVQQIPSATTPITAALVDRAGGRMVINHTDVHLFQKAEPVDESHCDGADAVVVDCRWPAGAIATLTAARSRGIPSVVDVDRPLTHEAAPILHLASHLVFSTDALCATALVDQPALALRTIRQQTSAWVAVTQGANGVSWLDEEGLRHRKAFNVVPVDTLAAGDVFHGAFTLALAEGSDEEQAITFASAAAAAKCTRSGGRAGIPDRTVVDDLITSQEGTLCT